MWFQSGLALFLLLASAAAPARAGWQAGGTPIVTATGAQIDPAIVPDGAGGAYIAWNDNRISGNADIFLQRVSGSGELLWPAEVQVTNLAGDEIGPAVAPGPGGGVLVTWTDERNGSNNRDIYIQYVSASGSPQWGANGIPVCTAALDQVGSEIASDGEGGGIVAWVDRRSGSNDIYAQRINFFGTALWTANGVVVGATAETQNDVKIISSGTGHAIVTWRDNRDADGEIYGQRLGPAGTALWTANGLSVSTGAKRLGTSYYGITHDGADGLIAAWHDQRVSGPGIYAMRVPTTGVHAWASDVPLTLEPYSASSPPAVVSDGSGGAIVAFQDYRNADSDIYVQRIDAAGVVQWDTDGYPLVTVAGTQYFPAAAADAGGAIVAWRDLRNGADDLYAQKLDAAGAVQWAAQGLAVNTAAGAQGAPQAAPGLSGGALFAWQDYRSDLGDIYAYGLALGLPAGVPALPWFPRALLVALLGLAAMLRPGIDRSRRRRP